MQIKNKYRTNCQYRSRLKPIKSDGHIFWATYRLQYTGKGFNKNCAYSFTTIKSFYDFLTRE